MSLEKETLREVAAETGEWLPQAKGRPEIQKVRELRKDSPFKAFGENMAWLTP